jgi:D-alanyl-D-alanine carboxypeptidase
MDPNNTPATSWTEAEQRVIALFVEKHGQTRSNAIRSLRGKLLRGITAEQILAQPVEAKLEQVQEPKEAPVKTKKAAPKKDAVKHLSMSKAERIAYAAKHDQSELEVYMTLCRKEGIEPAPSAAKAWAKQEKKAAKKAAK